MEHFKLDKLPPWAWGVAIVGGLAFWWWSQRGSSAASTANAASAGQGALPPAQGSINPVTPNCPQYPIPQCGSGQSLIWTQDQQGCPIPQCQDNGGSSAMPDQYVYTDGHMTFSQAQYIYRCWGDNTIRAWIALHGHPELATHSLFTALPAGIKLKVCGSF